ncbi:MAG: DUF3857 domain-containing protein [Candidatus Aminicenantes bacterium]|nr:DUF3857 domain-containing protein [Candidatus Aminicenantes bacterium]
MRKFAPWILVLALSLPGMLSGQETVEEIVKSAPARGKYPDSSAVVVRSAQTFTLDNNGARRDRHFRALGIFTLTGREKFSDFRIPYDKNKDTIDILMARTYKGDATAIDVEEKAVNDLTPPELAEADLYANILHRVLSFPVVDPGSVLVIDYEKGREGAGNVGGVVPFQFDEPVVKKELTVIIPGDKILKSKILGLTASFEEETDGAQKTYRLRAENLAQIKPEEYMPPLAEIASRVVFSTFSDWEEAARAFSESFFKAAVPSAEVKAFTVDLIKGIPGRNERIQRVFSFVVRDVRSVRFSFGQGGFEVNPAGAVLKNRYGDWKDKSALLAAMLKAAGFDAYPVLVHSRSVPPEEDVPTLEQFDAVLVAVDRGAGEEPLFLNPFADDSFFGYFREGRDSRGLAVKPGAVGFVPVRCLPEAESGLMTRIVGEIGPDGAFKGVIAAELSGFFDQRGRRELKDMTAKELDVFYKESVNKIGEDADALRNELSDPKDLNQKLKISQEFSARDFAVFQGPIMLIHLPQIPYAFAEVPSPSLAARRYAFRLPGEAEVRSEIVLKVPAGFEPLYLPEGFSYAKEYGDFSFAVSYEPDRSSVLIKRTALFKKKEIPLDRYDEFKAIMESFGLTKNNLILLEKK